MRTLPRSQWIVAILAKHQRRISFSPSLHIPAYNLQNFAKFRTPPHFVLGFVFRPLFLSLSLSCIPRFLECKGCFSAFRCLWSAERYVLFFTYDSFHLRSLLRRFRTLLTSLSRRKRVISPPRFSQICLSNVGTYPRFCFIEHDSRTNEPTHERSVNHRFFFLMKRGSKCSFRRNIWHIFFIGNGWTGINYTLKVGVLFRQITGDYNFAKEPFVWTIYFFIISSEATDFGVFLNFERQNSSSMFNLEYLR